MGWQMGKEKRQEKRDSVQLTVNVQQDKDPVNILPMREIPEDNFVPVPWSRSDILLFTNDYPKLRGKPVEWYQQTDRFVKLVKCLLEDLNTLLEIVVPADLWIECKRNVYWPTNEPERDKNTGAPSPEVMEYYYKVTEFLKTRILPKNIDWKRIDTTAQEAKESIHAYYERHSSITVMNSDDEDDQAPEIEGEDINEEYPLIEFFPMFTVKELHPDLQGMVKEKLLLVGERLRQEGIGNRKKEEPAAAPTEANESL
ncbi:hypothetical protein NDU88_002452 [Pleurodeles waltl]|uniref:Uncharacterized protein n=1 Tax=Pleurodeles waltl TaxID=8319 RepID=A0AAV7W428_PLEWA|nr:hypothetical protein NDU88_002452 [Pleurodeles waltl]